MTVNSTANRVSYTGNGTTTAFGFPFYFQMAADLVVLETVIATGVQTTKVLTTDYTISGTTDANGYYPNGGTVNAVTAPAATVTWTIYRDPARTQLTQHVDGDSMPAASIDGPLDKLTMIVQRHDDLLARSLRQPDGDTANIPTLPSSVSRANGGLGSYAGWDASGNPTTYVPAGGQAAVSVALSPVVTAATLATARTAMGLGGAAVEAIGQGLEDDGAGNLRVKLDTTTGTPATARSANGIKVDPSFFRGYFAGLTLSNDGVAPNTKIDISAGVCVDDTQVAFLKSTGALTVDFTINGAGGLDTGALVASKWYHVWLIGKADGTVAAFANRDDLTGLTPTLPTGYVYKKRRTSVKTDAAGHILPFSHNGNEILWSASINEANAVATSAAAQTQTLSGVPPSVKVMARIRANAATTAVILTSLDESDQAASNAGAGADIGVGGQGRYDIRTNTSQQIRVRASGAGTFSCSTFGWRELDAFQ